ncbi:MAG TPA: SDR family NAD(P)-dependent oxidoreductase [Alphaproteobacteria bacterium]|nr:SDR family NAD(P)-dependent oxidoreductase [Alphaproteobacteria bacterium]USO05597.1 MAG: SDR family NAD(P)-dependent oxidoreductase [Rhodospirillales bacterium]HOO82669.1 SDR family NAD(P)-dependent oxidoreductase [Alphaproteobacteria bacterium]
MPLKGKTVYITGGTGGIGTPLVQYLENAGAEVTAHDIEKEGDLVANMDKICAYLKDNTPDILINMAGYNVLDYCENQNLEAIVDLNMMVPMRLSQAVLPGMKARNSGQIINMGSMTALIPLPHLTGYVAAKAGLKGFNDALRRELGGTNIKLTHIAPRAVKTPMNSGVKAEVNKRTKVKYDDPSDVARWIFEAIIEQKPDVRFGWPERFFAFMHANFPFIIDNGLQKNRQIGEDALNTHHQTKEIKDEKTTTLHRAAS